MSYPYRNRTKLSDKLRGKSGDEILNELRNQLDADRKMFFESTPSWNSTPSPGPFSRAGNPLDETMPRGHQDIRSHLDDLAQRHPEFAEHLRCPPWAGEMSAPYTWRQSRRGSGSNGDNTDCGAEGGHWEHGETDPSPSHGRERQANLPQHGLRNTVDLGQQQQEQSDNHDKNRGQRAWSAPPDNRTQIPPDPPRFVSRLDFNPVNTNSTSANADQGKPPVAPKQPQAQQTQIPVQQQSSPNTKREEGKCVRHIPIFVEGRDEPLLPKNTAETTQNIPVQRVPNPPQSQPSSSSFAYGRPSHFTNTHFQNQGQSPPQKQQPQKQQPQKQQPQQSQKQQSQQPKKQPPSPSSQTSTAAPQQQQQKVPSAETEGERKSVPQAHKQPRLNDPIAQVQAIQKDVNDLKLKVEQFSGSSRKDKDYMYLDEMLTRNLLKLDNIETEGKDNVRQARKEVIRNIQQCISLLESKVPGAEENQNMPEDEIAVTEHNTMEVGNNGTSSESTQQDNIPCSQEEGKQDEDIPSDANKQQENENIPMGQIDNPVESEHKQSVMEVEPNTDTKENIVTEAANIPPETSSEIDKILTENNSKDSCKNADNVLEKSLGDVTTQMQVDNVESNKVEDSSNTSATEKVEGQEKMEVDTTTSTDKSSCQEPVACEITEGTPKTGSELGTEVTSEISSTCGVTKDNELVATGKPENSDVTSGTDSKNETVKSCDISKPVGQVSKLPKSPKGSPKKGKKGT